MDVQFRILMRLNSYLQKYQCLSVTLIPMRIFKLVLLLKIQPLLCLTQPISQVIKVLNQVVLYLFKALQSAQLKISKLLF